MGDELDATHQAAERARADATVWSARAQAEADAPTAQRLRADATGAEAQAAALAERAAQLEAADTARAIWYAATAATRDAARRAEGALASRGMDLDDPDELVTAAEWLAVHRAEQAAEDPHREITEDAELHDPVREHDRADAATAGPPVLETAVPDVREVCTSDATEHADTARRHRVPTADETFAAVGRAQVALAEIAARRDADAAREAEGDQRGNRREELARWADHDRTAEAAANHDQGQDNALQR